MNKFVLKRNFFLTKFVLVLILTGAPFLVGAWTSGLPVAERERRRQGEGAAGVAFSWARTTKVAWVFGYALLSERSGAKINWSLENSASCCGAYGGTNIPNKNKGKSKLVLVIA